MSRNGSSIRAPVLECFERKRNKGGREPQKPTISECVRIILALVEDKPPCFIILDALDELELAEREMLLNAFYRIFRGSVTPLRIFISSRILSEVGNRLAGVLSLVVPVLNAEDIHMYVETEVRKAIKQRRLLKGDVSERLRRDIVKTLNHRANGM